MNNIKWWHIFLIIINLVGFSIYFKHIEKRDKDRYSEICKIELNGIVDYSDLYQATAKVSIQESNKIFYFIPRKCETNEFCIEMIPQKGDSIYKKPKSDTIYVFHNGSQRIICIFKPNN